MKKKMATIKYKVFESELEKYFKAERHLITEDLIRYIFVKIHNSNKAQIEVPYIRTKSPATSIKIKPTCLSYFNNSLARADLYYEKNSSGITDGESDVVIEYKFHRCTKYSNNCTTSKIGSVFADLNRLSVLENNEKYLIYVFDQNMQNYFSRGLIPDSPRGYFDINQINVGDIYNISPSLSKNPEFFGGDFSKNALKGFDGRIVPDMSAFNYKIQLEYAGKFPNVDFYTVIYKVL